VPDATTQDFNSSPDESQSGKGTKQRNEAAASPDDLPSQECGEYELKSPVDDEAAANEAVMTVSSRRHNDVRSLFLQALSKIVFEF